MYGFVYKLGWSAADMWYIGCRYSKECKFEDMWNTYFTSSKDVQRYAMHNGKPDVIVLEKEVYGDFLQVLKEESNLIMRYDAIKSNNFFNKRMSAEFNKHKKKLVFDLRKPKVKRERQYKKPHNALEQSVIDDILSYVKHNTLTRSVKSISTEYRVSRQTIYNLINRHVPDYIKMHSGRPKKQSAYRNI